jgi:hypothetical protein
MRLTSRFTSDRDDFPACQVSFFGRKNTGVDDAKFCPSVYAGVGVRDAGYLSV